MNWAHQIMAHLWKEKQEAKEKSKQSKSSPNSSGPFSGGDASFVSFGSADSSCDVSAGDGGCCDGGGACH